jgi:LuxR family transcriptional regulator, quorum-sensing system regulator SdiA
VFTELMPLAHQGCVERYWVRIGCVSGDLGHFSRKCQRYCNMNNFYPRVSPAKQDASRIGATLCPAFSLLGLSRTAEKAATYALLGRTVPPYGLVTRQSIVGVNCADRVFSADALATLSDIPARLHIEAKSPSELTKVQRIALHRSVNGDRHTVAAAKLGRREKAIKANLKPALSTFAV